MRSEEMPRGHIARRQSRMVLASRLARANSQVVVLDARTLEALLVIRVENQATTGVVFSADGTRLITIDVGDSMVRVYRHAATPRTGGDAEDRAPVATKHCCRGSRPGRARAKMRRPPR